MFYIVYAPSYRMSTAENQLFESLRLWAAIHDQDDVWGLRPSFDEKEQCNAVVAGRRNPRSRMMARLRAQWALEAKDVGVAEGKDPTIIVVPWRCDTCRRPITKGDQCVAEAERIILAHGGSIPRREPALTVAQRRAQALAYVQAHPPATLLPKRSLTQALSNAKVLAKRLIDDEYLPPRRQHACWNCGLDHRMQLCPYPRGTFCLHCGEIGVYYEECRRCKPNCRFQ